MLYILYRISVRLVILVILVMLLAAAAAAGGQGPQNIAELTRDMEQRSGFFDFYWDEKDGKVWLRIDRWQEEFLYMVSLPAGMGSNDIGLDRGKINSGRMVRFERYGNKVLLVQPNYRFRAETDNPAERRAVQDAFAQSVLWGFEIAGVTGDSVLVDASDFLLRDANGVTATLQQTGQGQYKLDASRSAFYPPVLKSFPRNTELEVILTFTGEKPGGFVRQVTPTPQAVTVRQRHSFIALPDSNYTPRILDPRSGYFGIGYKDYAVPIAAAIEKQFIVRHRLQKQDDDAAVSEPVHPIVYYVDSGAPEPVRSALLEGARWWNEAFTAIGFQKAFRVELLPEDADPLDVRFNVIQWVHRATRGWSYGNSVIDPRTGEIIKGHVTLGSLRVRQDYLIAQGLLSPFRSDSSEAPQLQEMALARLRQLSAHEVGHTLGLAHNFAASVAERASVMDYPHPYVTIADDGSFDFSAAYGVGVGDWDKTTIAYGYQDFPDSVNVADALNAIIDGSIASGLLFISDQDARPAGGAHPQAHLWDNGADAADELLRIMKIRSVALNRFSESSIAPGRTFSSLAEVLVPIYLYHRYQVDAASKLLGGLFYTYAVRGDGQTVTKIVPAAQQRKALDVLISTIKPSALVLPDELLEILPPRAYGEAYSNESFGSRTGVTFDPMAAAETAADHTLAFVLHPERAGRLVDFHARDSKYPGLGEVIDKLLRLTWYTSRGSGHEGEIQRVVDNVVLYRLMKLAREQDAMVQARAVAFLKIDELRKWLQSRQGRNLDNAQKAHEHFALLQIGLFQKQPADVPEDLNLFNPVGIPAGPPIGAGSEEGGCGWYSTR